MSRGEQEVCLTRGRRKLARSQGGITPWPDQSELDADFGYLGRRPTTSDFLKMVSLTVNARKFDKFHLVANKLNRWGFIKTV